MTEQERKDKAAEILKTALLQIRALRVEVEVEVGGADANYCTTLIGEKVEDPYAWPCGLLFHPYGEKDSGDLPVGAALARESPTQPSYADAIATLNTAVLSGMIASRRLQAGTASDDIRKAVLASITAAPYRWCLKQIGETPP